MEKRSRNYRHVLGYLREISATVQETQRALKVQSSGSAPGEALEQADEVIRAKIADIREVFSKDAEMHEWCPDDVVHIETLWTTAYAAASRGGGSLDAAEMSALDEIVYRCESLTLAARVNDVLDNLRVGQGINFFPLFQDELPQDVSLQKKLLHELVEQSAVLTNGYVDEERGVIWRVADSQAKRRRSAVRIVGTAVLGGVLVWVACWLGSALGLEGWPLNRAGAETALITYVFTLAGSLAHVLVAGLILSRSWAGSLRSPSNDWMLWLNAREWQIHMGIVSLLVGFTFLTWTLAGGLTWQTAFFAGYSIDSVMDIFLDRFDLLAKTQARRITQEVSAGSVG